MAAIELNLTPSTKQLRQFGGFATVGLPFVAWIVIGKPSFAAWQPHHTYWLTAAGLAGLLGGAMAWFRPSMLKWPFVMLSMVTFPIGLVVSEIILVTIYCMAFVPLAIVFRVIGRDALERGIDLETTTYWTEKPAAKNVSSYYRQF